MIPKYTVSEIIQQINNKLDSKSDFMKRYNLSEESFRQLMSPTAIWTSTEYSIAADYLDIPVTVLLKLIPEEDLSSISFRALENTDEINNLVQQVNDIFDALTYQLKIGGVKRD